MNNLTDNLRSNSISNLAGKNIIITGTNRGIGKAILEECAKQGANIWAHARKATDEFNEQIDILTKKYQVEIEPLYFDVTNYDEMKTAVMNIRKEKIDIDGLINNAGITYNALFQMSTEENLRTQFEVNFFSVFLWTQYISKLMVRQKHGSIVNIASVAGIDGTKGKSVYGASKAAIISMTRSIERELGASGIRANCIAPGVIETEMLKTMPDESVRESIEQSDMKKSGFPDDIAKTAAYLISDKSSYITGQVLRVDGGM